MLSQVLESRRGGVGMTYSLQDQGGTNVSVSGAAAFGNP